MPPYASSHGTTCFEHPYSPHYATLYPTFPHP